MDTNQNDYQIFDTPSQKVNNFYENDPHYLQVKLDAAYPKSIINSADLCEFLAKFVI